MAIIKKTCAYCNKTTDLTTEMDLGKTGRLLIFSCGHSYVDKGLDKEVPLFERLRDASPEYCEIHGTECITTIQSATGKHLFPYQRDGIVAAYKNNGRFIFADEMGLGKTVQGLGTISLDPDAFLPSLFLCKSIAKTNWLKETLDWLGVVPQVITGSHETPFDVFKIHIISYDLLNRLDKKYKLVAAMEYFYSGQRGNETDARAFQEMLKGSCEQKRAWLVKLTTCSTWVLDEYHLIKNRNSQRTRVVKKMIANAKHVIGMSGTPTKNSATEHFTMLNIVRPEKFFRYESFCRQYCRYEYVKSATGRWVMKFTGLNNPAHFKEITKEFMIRRTTDEVMPQLPKLQKQQKFMEMDSAVQEVYDESEKAFIDWLDSVPENDRSGMDILAQLALLRHQTSLAKVDYTCDLVQEWMLSQETEEGKAPKKIAIFTHHIDSREFLYEKMKTFLDETLGEGMGDKMVFMLSQSGSDVQDEIEQFKDDPEARILILSTLSHGESINLQFMSDCILHERQWNPSNEDQAISGRFRRIGQESKHINCMIPTAIGTIDEYFVELVERKRAISKELDTGEIEDWQSGGFVSELADKIREKGKEKWRLT